MTKTSVRIAALAAMIHVLAHTAPAQTPLGTAFTYQGQLKQAGQAFNGPADLLFDLYDADVGGNLLGSQALNGVAINGGLFTVQLNTAGEFGAGAFSGEQRWLEISVNGTPLSPRQELTATPYALHAAGPWVTNAQDVSYTAGNVGIGTATPATRLDVVGDARLAGRVAGGNDGVIGPIDPYYDAIFDFSHTIQDFSSRQGWLPFESLIQVDPTIDLTGADRKYIYGHDFETVVRAGNPHDIRYVQGPYCAAFHEGTGHIDVLGGGSMGAQTIESGDVDYQNGAYFFSVVGFSPFSTASITDNHVIDISSGHAGTAGSITNNVGVYIASPYHDQPLTNHYGIYLENQDFGQIDSYAIYTAGGNSYLNGDLDVTGTLSKGAGSFKIDHPLDPENKFLYHSFVESPDMMNIYNGNVMTDAQGYATVSLPDWFDALNRDFRYQLTVIGQFAQAIVAEEIHDNRFAIRTDKPSVKVSWQVTGIRHDAYAEAHRIPLEAVKPAAERGTFLHPIEHGQPPQRGIEAVRRARLGTSAASSLSDRLQHHRRGAGPSIDPAGLKPATESAHTKEESK